MKSTEWHEVKVKDRGLKAKAEAGACVRRATANSVVRMSPFYYGLPPEETFFD